MRTVRTILFLAPFTFGCDAKLDGGVDTSEGAASDADVSSDADEGDVINDTSNPPVDTSDSAAPNPDTADIDSADTASDTAAGSSDTATDTADSGGAVEPVIDEDEDGFTAIDGDCDDTDPTVFPGADEVCDDKDNDCDELVDEEPVDGLLSYLDMDSDGYGDDRFSDLSCASPPGYVLIGGDCDDTSAATHPDAAERCDDLDNDCDDEIDEGALYTWYADSDADGYGDADAVIESCDPGPGYVASATDCDDTDPATNPGTYEICDGVDNDCDESVDEAAVDATDWYPDADADGYGAGTDPVSSCTALDGHASESGDCNDDAPSIHPGAEEVCDDEDVDEDCSGLADDADGSVVAASTSIWYRDSDGDGFGNLAYGLARCDSPDGYVDTPTDCDDSNADISPDAAESCNGIDDDCDGETDEDDAIDPTIWYADSDGDTFGDADSTAAACSAPDGYVEDDTDCNDATADVYPGADEWCNGIDDDCDGTSDEDDAADASTWYADTDSDTFGDADSIAEACSAPDGYVEDDTDCDDSSSDVFPGAEEHPDGFDDDCDGTIDEGTDLYDDDGDGYSESDGDCDDGDSSIAPGAEEEADEIDQDCDGTIDEGTEVFDDDGDGFTELDGDCDDGSSAVYPDATEIPDGIDQDCDGTTDEGTGLYDDDGDGWPEVEGDCNDEDPAIYPGAEETCNGLDDDCDGVADEGSPEGSSTWYRDSDSDGFGDPTLDTEACSAPDGYVADSSDCYDEDPSSYPGAEELCDGVDNDCDGLTDDDDPTVVDTPTWYRDADGDTYGSSESIRACSTPDGYTDNNEDCNDGDDRTYPGAPEDECEGDRDCDGIEPPCSLLAITVEGVSSDFIVEVDCEMGDHYCQAREICNEITGETCVHQEYDCAYGYRGSWYPPSRGGSSNFNFAYAYDFAGGDYGNICSGLGTGVMEEYGLGSRHSGAGYGHWYRR